MKKFESLEVKVIKFVSDEVITTSYTGGSNTGTSWGTGQQDETAPEENTY